MRPSTTSFAALLLATAMCAQKASVFHLPAGDYQLGELLTRCEQAVKAPIVRDQIDDLGERRQLHLQCALALPTEAWEDVLASVLYAHDLVLTYDAGNKRHEVLPRPARRVPTGWIAARARTMTIAELAARPSHKGPVRVTFDPAVEAAVVINMIRPLGFGAPGGIAVVADGEQVAVTGLAPSVRSVLAAVAAVDPSVAAALPTTARSWPRAAAAAEHTLPAGEHPLGVVVDALARATGRNLLLDPSVPTDLTFALPAPIRGDVLAFEDALTRLLWTQHVAVLGLAPAHGLHLVRVVTPMAMPTVDEAVSMAPAEVLARPNLVCYAEVVVPMGADSPGFEALMAQLRGRAPTSMGLACAGTKDRLVLQGSSHELAPMLQKLPTAPSPK